ncbi:MAG: hypothetical protein GY861_13850 [bacterium]|nr:hypothetical protein [bacterium]
MNNNFIDELVEKANENRKRDYDRIIKILVENGVASHELSIVGALYRSEQIVKDTARAVCNEILSKEVETSGLIFTYEIKDILKQLVTKQEGSVNET